MEKLLELKYHELEEGHWWFLARRNIIFNLIKKNSENSKIIEIGCSGGPLLIFLQKKGFYNITGIDISKKAIEICKKRGLQNVRIADGIDLDFENDSFDIIIASDVLEHINDEGKAIIEWHRILKRDGILIIFVPAFQFLWSGHDIIHHHFRRYSKSQLTTILNRNNFQIKRISYWNFLLFFPISFIRIIQKLIYKNSKPSAQLYRANFFVNNILLNIIKLENQILAKDINFPVGISIFCIAKKI
jgi:SAM-dependent methyltransferase